MACALTSGYAFSTCKGGAGGISQVMFTEYANLVTVPTLTAGVYTAFALSSGKQFRLYDLDREIGFASDPFAYTKESGSRVYNPKLGFKIKGWSTAMQLELSLLSQNYLIAIVKYNSGIYRVFGIEKGLDLMTIADDSGTNYEDVNGFDLAFETKSTIPAYAISSGLIATLLAPAA